MRSRVTVLMREFALNAREMVADETPAILASSIEVTPFRRIAIPSLISICADFYRNRFAVGSRRCLDRIPEPGKSQSVYHCRRIGHPTLPNSLEGVHRRIDNFVDFSDRGAASNGNLAPAAPGVDPHERVGIKEGDRRRTAGRPVASSIERHERAVGETRSHRTDQIHIEPTI